MTTLRPQDRFSTARWLAILLASVTVVGFCGCLTHQSIATHPVSVSQQSHTVLRVRAKLGKPVPMGNHPTPPAQQETVLLGPPRKMDTPGTSTKTGKPSGKNKKSPTNTQANAPKKPTAKENQKSDKQDREAKTKDSENNQLASRLKKLEGDWEKWQDAEKKAREQASTQNSPVQVHGRIHLDGTLFPTTTRGIDFFENPDTGIDPDNRVEFRRLRITFRGDVLDNMFYKLDLEFGNPSSPRLRDAYMGFRELPYLQTLTIGNVKRPLSLSTLNSSNVEPFIERPLVFGETDIVARRIGIASSGYTEDEALNWNVGFFLQTNVQDTGTFEQGDSFPGSLVGRLSGTPWYDETSKGRGYWHLGVASFVAQAPPVTAGDLDSANNIPDLQSRPELRSRSRWISTGPLLNADMVCAGTLENAINMGSLLFVSELFTVLVQRTNGQSNLFFHGGYAYVGYFLTGEHQPINRKRGVFKRVQPLENFFRVDQCGGGIGSGWGAWQVLARISYFDLTDQDIQGGTELNFTLGLNWYFNQNARMMFNAVAGRIWDHAPVGGFTSGQFTGASMRMQIFF